MIREPNPDLFYFAGGPVKTLCVDGSFTLTWPDGRVAYIEPEGGYEPPHFRPRDLPSGISAAGSYADRIVKAWLEGDQDEVDRLVAERDGR